MPNAVDRATTAMNWHISACTAACWVIAVCVCVRVCVCVCCIVRNLRHPHHVSQHAAAAAAALIQRTLRRRQIVTDDNSTVRLLRRQTGRAVSRYSAQVAVNNCACYISLFAILRASAAS